MVSRLEDETQKRRKTSAVVFAPHQDDETLGCGGTILLKRQSGAQVACVFMADGSSSHRRFMAEEDLRRLRKAEAIEATEVLGVPNEDVYFLGFPDGKLNGSREAAVAQTLALLDRYRTDEVYVPCRGDGLPDHEHTYGIVLEAVNRAGLVVEICEYPIWAWNQWPWVPFKIQSYRAAGREFLKMVWAGFGLRLIREFRSGVFVGDIIDIKRQALSKYRSQMTALQPGTAWPTLGDVSEGEFLPCFFQDYEIFRCADRHIRN